MLASVHCNGVQREHNKKLNNGLPNLDLYRFYPDISDDEGLGRLYADELGTIDIPEHIQNYFDYEAYGRDVRINEGGVFAPGGYVSAVPEGFKEYYHGPQDIPPEHRIFAYPEKAEPMSTAPTTASAFLNTPAHSTPKFLAERSARPSTVSMKMWYCPLSLKC